LQRTFVYRVPESLAGDVEPGRRVIVPFGRRVLTGWVDEVLHAAPESPGREIREILDVPDPEPVLAPELLDLCRWVAHYYAAPIGLTYRAALPAPLTTESAERLTLNRDSGAQPAGATEAALVAHLARQRGPVKLSALPKTLGPGAWTRAARRLAERGLLSIEQEAPAVEPPRRARQIVALIAELPSVQARDRTFHRARRQRELFEFLESSGGHAELAHLTGQLKFARSVIDGLVEKQLAAVRAEKAYDPFPEPPPAGEVRHTPTPAQAAAIARLLDACDGDPPPVFVLKGVTGSGKTLVYIEILRELVTRRGRGAILLVPEISLTPQTLARFRAAFGADVALLHSALSDGERYAAWDALRRGLKRIVIGARSAVFAPVRELGAIIIDEEHESSYKQNDPVPRYHAREVAAFRARRARALCLLGSATPSLESWSNARSGPWELIELPERIGARPLPEVRIVDLREERKARRAAGEGESAASAGPLVLSAALEEALRRRLERGEQSILLLNRRGYSNFVQCRDCGAVFSCHQCNVSLTLHRHPPRLVCHHCFHQEAAHEACRECGSSDLGLRGVGTEQVERVLVETFPASRIARMDVDTTSRKWSHHEILSRVERREVDILLGTQMIAKGLDFPAVTLVGVINADVGINLPDFRASERTFQLLTQVAGRAGRGPAAGEVIIQTSLPGHYAVRFALAHDYDGFAARELAERSGPAYPPHVRLANLLFSGAEERRVQEAAEAASAWLDGLIRARTLRGISLVGPAPCPIDRIRRRWRWHLLLKAVDPATPGAVLRYFAGRFQPAAHDVQVEIDRDPLSLL
jgi:primosomal protein N' (replication factor Y)